MIRSVLFILLAAVIFNACKKDKSPQYYFSAKFNGVKKDFKRVFAFRTVESQGRNRVGIVGFESADTVPRFDLSIFTSEAVSAKDYPSAALDRVLASYFTLPQDFFVSKGLEVTARVSSISDTEIKGSFQGPLININGTDTIHITEGSFYAQFVE